MVSQLKKTEGFVVWGISDVSPKKRRMMVDMMRRGESEDGSEEIKKTGQEQSKENNQP